MIPHFLRLSTRALDDCELLQPANIKPPHQAKLLLLLLNNLQPSRQTSDCSRHRPPLRFSLSRLQPFFPALQRRNPKYRGDLVFSFRLASGISLYMFSWYQQKQFFPCSCRRPGSVGLFVVTTLREEPSHLSAPSGDAVNATLTCWAPCD